MKLLPLLLIASIPLAGCSSVKEKKPITKDRDKVVTIVGVSDKSRVEVESCITNELNGMKESSYTQGKKLSPNQTSYVINIRGENNYPYNLYVSEYKNRRVIGITHKKESSEYVQKLDSHFLNCSDKL